MPEESINIFISNIYAIVIFTGIFLLIFLILFLLSRYFKRKTTGKKIKKPVITKDTRYFVLHKDTSLSATLFVAGLIFVSIVFLILLVVLSVYFVTSFQVDRSLYLLFLLVFLILLTTVYVIRSKILKG
jgi:hypothetical protein